MEEAAKFFFKAKMEAEAKEMQARGMKEGQDFLKSVLFLLFFLKSRNIDAVGVYRDRAELIL